MRLSVIVPAYNCLPAVIGLINSLFTTCLLYTSDAADE